MRALSPFCLCFVLLCAAPALAAVERTPGLTGAVEQSKAEAKTLLEAGSYDQACDLYLRLMREAPDDEEINLGLALAASGARRHNQAVIAYERLVQMYPNVPSFYVGLARAYLALGDEQIAKEYLDRAQSLDPDATQADADRVFANLKRERERYSFHGKLRAGFLYDSNANQGTESDKMTLGLYDVRVRGADRVDSMAAYFAANFDFGLRLTEDGPFWLVGDLGGWLKGNFNAELLDRHVRNMLWGRGAAGLRYLSSRLLVDVRVKAEGVDYDNYQGVSAVGPEMLVAWAVLPKFQIITKANWEHRAYSEVPDRNGSYFSVGEYGRLFFGKSNHEVILGARYINGTAQRSIYRYEGWEGRLGFVFKLPWSFELAPFVSYTEEYYQGPASILETEYRMDRRWATGAMVTYHITDNWAVEAGYQYVGNRSSSALHTYDQHVVSTGISWSF